MLTVFHLVLMLLFNSISHLLSYAAFGSDEALCWNTYTVKPALKGVRFMVFNATSNSQH